MKQKLKMFYECMRPNVALLMVTILVVSLLSVGMVEETKAADLGGRTNWLDADNVKGKVFEEKGVTTQDSYTEYVLKDGEYVPNTVSINSAAELGSRENPYAIESEEDLILFGQLNAKEYPGKYFLLTKKEYDMQGDKKYMIPLFPGVVAPSMPPDTGFQGNLIGNQAIIKNAYIVNNVDGTIYYAGLFSSLYEYAVIWDLNLENAIYQVEHNSSCKIGGLAGVCSSMFTYRIMNCNLSYTVNYLSPYPMYFYGLCGGYPNAYNCNVILKDINSNAALTIQAIAGYASMYNNTIQNCTSTITKDGFGFTISENTLTESPSFQLSTEETTYATINIPSSGYIYREGNKIYAPGNQLIMYKNGAFQFNESSKEVKMNDVVCDAAATYNTVQLDYNDETTDTVIYPAGETYTLPVPEKEECEFWGWTSKDMEEPTTNVELGADFVGVCTYVANWVTDINTCDITFVDGNVYTYTGNAIQPKFLVKDGDKVLEEGKDYNVTYHNNVEISSTDIAFSPRAVIEGLGQYTGCKELLFTIEKATPIVHTLPTASKIQEGQTLASSTLTEGIVVSNESVSGNDVNCMEGTFRWKDETIVPTVSDNGVTKYTVVFEPDEDVHYHSIEMEVPVIVEEKTFIDLNDCDITFNNGSTYTYVGKEIKPVVLVEYEGVLLVQDEDFEVSYINNVNAATMDSENAPTVVIEGIGDYTGRKDLTFTIKKAIPLIQTMPTASKIQEGQTLASSTLTGGIALSGIATNDIYGSSVDLVEGTFNWKDGTIIPTLADSEVTKYTVVFTPDDTDNFETVEMDLTIIVEKLLISLYDCDICITDGPAYSYTGEEVKPAILVKYKDTILEENKDYKITYTNNVNAATDFSTNAPTVVVEGIGKYTGSKSFTFTIEKASPLIQTVPTASKIQEGESLATSTFTGGVALGVCDVSGNRLNSLSGTFSWKDNTFVPTLLDSGVTKYTVVFTPEDTDNYNILEFDITVDVEKKPLINIETCSISFINENIYIYNGQKIAPKIVIKNGDKILEKGKDYKVSYMNNINAATMDSSNAPTVFIEGIGDYIGSTSLTFTIEKATPVIEVAPTASKIQEGEALSASVLTGGIVSQVIIVSTNSIAFKGTFSWKDDSIVPTLADSGVTKYTVIFTPNDITNYNTVEGDTVVIVEKKSSSNQPDSGDVDPEKPGSNDSDTQKPGSGDSGVQKPANQAQIGKSTTDTKNTATYIVTSSEMNAVEVAYVAPTKETKNVTIPETVTLKDNIVAKVTSIEAGAFKKNTKIQTITISKNVKTIGNEAFRGCKNLKKVKGVKNVTKIGKNAFANCNKLSSVTLGSNVTTIGEKAFYKCTVLKKITISKNVTSIGKSAFEGCKNLKTVNIKTTKLTKKNVKKNAFKGTHSKAKFDVPNSKKKSYTSILKARGVSKKATIK